MRLYTTIRRPLVYCCGFWTYTLLVRGIGASLARAAPSPTATLPSHLASGFGASIATFVPSSAVWWSAYGAYQKAVWHQLDRRWQASSGKPIDRTSNRILSVQTFSGMLAGCTSAVLTNPLDVVKTRLQVGCWPSSLTRHQPA